MKKQKRGVDDKGELRRRAEERVGEDPTDAQRLVHELQVHQVELEMQNEELQRARDDVEEGLARYAKLYELAPVGFLTLVRDGEIRQLNLAAASLWGLERSKMSGRCLGSLVPADQRTLLDAFLARVFGSHGKETCELEIRPHGAPASVVELTAAATEDGLECRVAATDITARRRAEEARKESEERYRGIFSGIPDGIIIHDERGVLLDVNDVMAQRLGVPRDELAGRRLTDFLAPEHASSVKGNATQTLAGQLPPFETTYVSVSGSQTPAEVHERRVRWRNGEAVLSVSRDITERKWIENALRESEEKYRRLYSSMSEGVAMHDLVHDAAGRVVDYVVTDVNPAFESITGLSRQGVVGRRAGEVYGTGAPPYLDVYEKVVETGKPARFEIDFEPMRKCFAVSAFSPGKGRFATVFEDITDRKRAEAALRANEEKFRTIFENSSSAMAIVERDTTISMVNREYCKLGGYEESDVIGRSWTTQIPPADLERLKEYNRRRLVEPSSAPRQYEFMFFRKDGAIRDCLISVAVIPSNGQIIASFVDITEQKQALKERDNLQASLAQSDRLASMGMLAAGVAHEINNPLAYVLYNIESLAEDLPRLADGMRRCHAALTAELGSDGASRALGPNDEVFSPAAFDDAVSRLREALEGGQRIKRITRSLSTFSRVERAEVMPVNVQTSIEHAITMALNEIKYRARITREFGVVPAVLASDGQLAQVLLNLLINAAHAIDEGDVENNEIRVRTFAEGETVCIEVRDTGRGIAPEHQPRIFEPFFTTKEIGAGSGLGLSICRNIIGGFGGEIGFESELGKGTRFLVRLPRMPSGWGPALAASEERDPETPAVRGRILVVDDEAGIRASLSRILGKDHEVVSAESGQAAKELLETDRAFDLVLCDLMMPKLSGMALHKWLATRDPALAEQVVFITGGAFTPGASKYLAEIRNLRLEKPFDIAGLRRLASELVLAARTKSKG